MDKLALQTELTRSHQVFLDYIQQLTDVEFTKQIEQMDSWAAIGAYLFGFTPFALGIFATQISV